MKVLITSDCYTSMVNGVATSTRNLEKCLRNAGVDVRVLTLSSGNKSYSDGNVTFIRSLNADKIYPDVRVSLASRSRQLKALIEWKPDIIHSQSEWSTFIMARYIAKCVHCPIVHTYHTVYEEYAHYLFANNDRLGKNAAKAVTTHVARRVDGLIAPTDKISDLLISYGCHTSISVMPTGLDLEKIAAHAEPSEIEALRKSLGIPDGNKIVTYTGRLAPEKNIEEIVEYMGRIRPENVTLMIVGDGPARQSIEEKIAEYKIDFAVMTGMIKPQDMHKYYKMADIFVSASQTETQGLTYIEALANGLPILCRWDKCLDGVLLDGQTGYAYTTEQQFKEYLEKMLHSDLSKMSDNAVQLIYKKFSLETFAENAINIYKNCLKHYVYTPHRILSLPK